MELKTQHYFGIFFGLFIIALDFILLFDFTKLEVKEWYFNPVLILGIFVGGIFFIIDITLLITASSTFFSLR